jgi:ACT domain-containing protein
MTSDKGTMSGSRIIISVLGHDRVGIIASVANILSDNNVNILDISQTIMQEFFTMMLIADMENSTKDLADIKEMLNQKGQEIGVRIDAQHEDVFRYMHRI